MKKYKVAGREYILKPLVMGQVIELAKYIAQHRIDFEGIEDFQEFILKYLEHLPYFLAIALTPKDKNLKDRDIEEETQFLRDNLPVDTMLDMVQDFLKLHDLVSLAEKIQGIVRTIAPSQTV